MTTPDVLTAPANAPANHPSVAEAVLAEAQAAHADADAPDAPDIEPSMVAAMEAADPDPAADDAPARTRNLSWDDAIKQVPPDIRHLMKNMRADYTRKTQEIADQRRDFVREREALMAGTAALKDVEVPEYDPFNEQTVNARIEAEVSKRLREALEPMQAEYQTMQAEDAYQAFTSAHPDFTNDTALRSEVQHLLEHNAALDLETAYWAAKGKQAKTTREAERVSQSAARKARKEAALVGTAAPRRSAPGGRPTRGDMRRMNNADLLALAKSLHRNQ